MASAIRATRTELSRIPGAMSLRSSSTCTIGYYNADQCAHQLLVWMKWHEHWAYHENVDIELPSNYPVRVRAVERPDAGFDRMSESSWEKYPEFDEQDERDATSVVCTDLASTDGGENECPNDIEDEFSIDAP